MYVCMYVCMYVNCDTFNVVSNNMYMYFHANMDDFRYNIDRALASDSMTGMWRGMFVYVCMYKCSLAHW